MKKSRLSRTLAFLLCLVLALSVSAPALGCTGYYVGKNASADGSVIIGRISDMQPSFAPVRLEVTERVENVPGRTFFDEFPLPDTTWKCVSLFRGGVLMSGINEWGVACTGPLSVYSSKVAIDAGNAEKDTVSFADYYQFVLLTCKTAGEAIRELCRLYDAGGAHAYNSTMIADQNEAWYFWPVTRYQYCAVKLPDDCVSFYGNMPMLGTVDPDSPDVICSPDLFTLPEKYGFAVYDENGNMDLFKTYAQGKLIDYSNMRTWRGHQLMAPSTAGAYDPDTLYPLAYQPDHPISLNDLSLLVRDRYEGTEYCPETTGRQDVRPIAYSHAVDATILQLKPDLPADISGVMWTCMANTEFAPFVPVSAAMSEFPAAWMNGDAAEPGQTASWPFKELYGLCVLDRENYGSGIKAYWEQEDARRFALMEEKLEEAKALYGSDPAGAAALLSTACTTEMEKALEDCKAIIDSLIAYIVDHCGIRDILSVKYVPDPTVTVKEPNVEPFQPFKPLQTNRFSLGNLTFASAEEMNAFIVTLSAEELHELLNGTGTTEE